MVRCYWGVLAIVCLFGLIRANPAASVDANEGRGLNRNSIQTGDDIMDSIYSDCLRKDSVSCVKYKLFSFMDKMLSSKDSFAITEGVTVVKTPNAKTSEGAPRSLDDEKNDDIETMVVNRVERFLETHSIKMDLKGTDVLNAVSSAGRALGDAADSLGLTEGESGVEEARGKKRNYTNTIAQHSNEILGQLTSKHGDYPSYKVYRFLKLKQRTNYSDSTDWKHDGVYLNDSTPCKTI